MDYSSIYRRYYSAEITRKILGSFRVRNTFSALVILLLGLWCVGKLIKTEFIGFDGYSMTAAQKVSENSAALEEDINLAFVLHNDIYTKQFYTLFKNILYYQGRSVHEDRDCKLKIETVQNSHCKIVNSRTVQPIHLHFLTPNEVQMEIREYFRRSNLTKIRITFYDWRLALSQTQGDERRLSRANVQTLKMMWPELFAPDVRKAISLDTDLIFNQNIQELWGEFSRFRSEEMVGGVLEQWGFLQGLPSTKLFPILRSGVNSGVILLDLDKIRRTNWTVWWRQVEREMLSSPPGIPYGDQGIINTMLFRRPEIFHEISCEWNFIPNKSNFKDYCLIAWVVRVPSRSECLTPLQIGNRVVRLPSIVHLAGKEKPEKILKRPYFGNPKPVKDYKEFSADDVRNTFLEVYYAHREMDIGCYS